MTWWHINNQFCCSNLIQESLLTSFWMNFPYQFPEEKWKVIFNNNSCLGKIMFNEWGWPIKLNYALEDCKRRLALLWPMPYQKLNSTKLLIKFSWETKFHFILGLLTALWNKQLKKKNQSKIITVLKSVAIHL